MVLNRLQGVARRGGLVVAALATVAGCSQGGGAESPGGDSDEKPFEGETIDFVVPFDPGGGYDTYTRMIAPYLAECLGAEIVVRNEPGAGSLLATNATAVAEPDGSRIQIMNMPGAVAAQIAGDEGARFDLSEFSWIGRIAAPPEVVLTGADSEFESFEDLLEQTEPVQFVATGPGASDYINANVIAQAYDIPYEVATGFAGAGEATAAVVAGQADIHVMPFDSVLKSFSSGDARPLVVMADELPKYHPETPLVGEFEPPKAEGQELLDDLAALTETGRSVAGPPGMDENLLSALREGLTCAMEDQKLLDELDSQKRPVTFLEGAEYAEVVEQALNPSDAFRSVIESSY